MGNLRLPAHIRRGRGTGGKIVQGHVMEGLVKTTDLVLDKTGFVKRFACSII